MLHWIAVAVMGIDVAAARLDVQRTLDNMSAAALDQDARAYLANIAPDDPEFLNEQRYFANDLKKKPPAEVRWEVVDTGTDTKAGAAPPADPREPGAAPPPDGVADPSATVAPIRLVADGVLEATVEVRWRLPGKDGPLKERKVAFTARFIRGTGESPSWLYGGEAWNVLHAPGVVVMFDDGMEDLASRTAEAFESIRGTVEEEFDLAHGDLPNRAQKIKIYAKMNHLQQSISLGYVMPLGGWNEPGESIKMLANTRTAATGLRNVLAHEYGHVATFELGPAANLIPWWLIEGAAEIAAQPFARNLDGRRKAVGRWVRDDKLAPWDEIADFDRTPAKHHGNVYAQGHTMAAYITERYGRAQRNRWLTSMARGMSLEEATRDALSTGFEELDAGWRAWLAEVLEPVPEPAPEPASP